MNSNEVSKQSLTVLIPYMEWRGWTLRPYDDFESQCTKGDYFCTHSETGKTFNLECKAEEKDKYNNLFIEEWSNRNTGRRGWLHNLTLCDILLYHFLDTQIAYVVHFDELREFDYSPYKLKPQRKTQQANDTWGYGVPIMALEHFGVIQQEFNLKAWALFALFQESKSGTEEGN